MGADGGAVAPTPGRTPLLVDAMCGRLATYLRMCGYDTAYALDRGVEDDDALAELADSEGRLLVTRDRALARRTDGVLLDARAIEDQLRELREHGFTLALGEPVRCARCNGTLEPVDDAATTPDYAPDPGERRVWRCRDCGQCFWEGSHWDDVARRLAAL
jgi:uncharacterized protein with PIN domain